MWSTFAIQDLFAMVRIEDSRSVKLRTVICIDNARPCHKENLYIGDI